jgi:polyvinyl alcohol dehydrogenase (cytochrome)
MPDSSRCVRWIVILAAAVFVACSGGNVDGPGPSTSRNSAPTPAGMATATGASPSGGLPGPGPGPAMSAAGPAGNGSDAVPAPIGPMSGAPTETAAPPVAGPDPDAWTSFGGAKDNQFARPDSRLELSRLSGVGIAWNVDAPGVTSTPAVYDGIAYWWDMGQSDSGTFHATRVSDGSELWARKFARGSTASPFVDESAVYAGDRDALVRALDRKTGKTLWETKVSDLSMAQLWSSPIIAGGVLIVGVGGKGTGNGVGATTDQLRLFGGAVIGLNAETGAKLWDFQTTVGPDGTKFGAGAAVWSSASIDTTRKLLYVGTGNSYYAPASPYSDSLIALDYTTTDPKGKLVWSKQFTANDNFTQGAPNGPDWDVGATPTLFSAGSKDLVGVGDKGGRFWVMERDLKPDANGQNTIVWQRMLSGPGGGSSSVMSPAAYHDGTIYVAPNSNGRNVLLFALDAATGNPKWGPIQITGINYGNLLVFKDMVMLATATAYASNAARSKLYAFHTADGTKDAWEFPLPQQHGGGLSVYKGTILVGYGFHFLSDAMEPVPGGLLAVREGGATPVIDESEPTGPTYAPTFSAVYKEVLVERGCTQISCHGATSLGMIDNPATAYAILLAATANGPSCAGAGALVVPNQPEQSVLYQKLATTPPCGGSMPPNAPLTQQEIDQVAMWIQMGATNN